MKVADITNEGTWNRMSYFYECIAHWVVKLLLFELHCYPAVVSGNSVQKAKVVSIAERAF